KPPEPTGDRVEGWAGRTGRRVGDGAGRGATLPSGGPTTPGVEVRRVRWGGGCRRGRGGFQELGVGLEQRRRGGGGVETLGGEAADDAVLTVVAVLADDGAAADAVDGLGEEGWGGLGDVVGGDVLQDVELGAETVDQAVDHGGDRLAFGADAEDLADQLGQLEDVGEPGRPGGAGARGGGRQPL